MESLQAVSLYEYLQKLFGLTLSDTLLFDYPNIDSLSDYIVSLIPWNSLTKTENQPSENNDETLPSSEIPETDYQEYLYDSIETEIETMENIDVVLELEKELSLLECAT